VECNPHGGRNVDDKLYELSQYYLKNFNKEYKQRRKGISWLRANTGLNLEEKTGDLPK